MRLTWPVVPRDVEVEGEAHVLPLGGLGVDGGGEVHEAQPRQGADRHEGLAALRDVVAPRSNVTLQQQLLAPYQGRAQSVRGESASRYTNVPFILTLKFDQTETETDTNLQLQTYKHGHQRNQESNKHQKDNKPSKSLQ